MSRNNRYEKAKLSAVENGTWPDIRGVRGCEDCPLRHERDSDILGCASERHVYHPFTEEKAQLESDSDNWTPEWCPLRFGMIRIGLTNDD